MKSIPIESGDKLRVAHWKGIKWFAPVWVTYLRTTKGGNLSVVVAEGPDKGAVRSVAWNQCTHHKQAGKDAYNATREGSPLPTIPNGWEIIPEGEDIPQRHRECREDYHTGNVWWCHPRVCRSTMTPIHAMVWGAVRAFARPTGIDQ